jgi:hypothetical protein
MDVRLLSSIFRVKEKKNTLRLDIPWRIIPWQCRSMHLVGLLVCSLLLLFCLPQSPFPCFVSVLLSYAFLSRSSKSCHVFTTDVHSLPLYPTTKTNSIQCRRVQHPVQSRLRPWTKRDMCLKATYTEDGHNYTEEDTRNLKGAVSCFADIHMACSLVVISHLLLLYRVSRTLSVVSKACVGVWSWWRKDGKGRWRSSLGKRAMGESWAVRLPETSRLEVWAGMAGSDMGGRKGSSCTDRICDMEYE